MKKKVQNKIIGNYFLMENHKKINFLSIREVTRCLRFF